MNYITAENMMWVITGITVVALVAISIFVYRGEDDNPAEQVAEKMIEMQTGIEIDLSPE